jgi:Ca-activated chloride channel family protein
MRKIHASTLLLMFLLLTLASYPQAGRPAVPTEGKKNQRAAPTPTVEPKTGSQAGITDDEIIRVNTQLVSVPVRVMDRKGRFIGGIPRESFKIFENGEEQELALFGTENEPFTVALVLDMSYSTKFKLAEIQSAAIAFIDQLRPEDRVTVISFDAEVRILCDPTNDRKEIAQAIKRTRITTGTSLYEAVDVVMNRQLRGVEGRKAIILFTDGVDTTSRRVDDLANLNDAMELDSLIYTIKYDTFADVQKMKNVPINQPTMPAPNSTPSPIPQIIGMIAMPGSQGTTEAEYKRAGLYLQGLADRTGGRLYEATSLVNLADAYSKIASELREFYSVGYYPSETREPNKPTNVKVKVDREGVVVRSRETFVKRKKTGR